MTKAEIVNEVAKATGIEKTTVLRVVESFMESVKTSLINGEPVFLRGFGSFIIKKRAEKNSAQHQGKDHYNNSGTQYPGFQAGKGICGSGKEIIII